MTVIVVMVMLHCLAQRVLLVRMVPAAPQQGVQQQSGSGDMGDGVDHV
jgi:hypothetical protein